MRISDWSSDVCSSDLGARGVPTARLPREVAQGGAVMTRSASRRRRLSLACALTLCSAVALGGCATFGGNIRGDFSCAAPDGICAPSSTIDDRALAMISAEGTDGDTRPAEIGRAQV